MNHNIMRDAEKEEDKEKGSSSMTEKLLKSRKIIISSDVNSKLANRVIHQLLLLEEDKPDESITMFINSPGGEVHSGFAIYDMMQFVKPMIKTVVMGLAASFGSLLSTGAEEGHRYALTNAMILIHQPLICGVLRGTASDIEIHANEMIKLKDRIIDIYVQTTGKTYEEVKKDINRDYWMTAQQALEYGPKRLIDKVITSIEDLK
ncbi:MAG: ATP-dependent Clp protease proteolytic subunit [bacterium]|nr:MAG: ATP-dependent Clp protease proteolytic subunit [bacterium]